MRTSRFAGLAVCLLLGASGCAGLHHRPAATPEGPVASPTAPGWGLRGWWARKFQGGAYQSTARSGAQAVPPASAWPGNSGGGWPAIYQFSKPPWVTRQPERAPIFSRNATEAPSQPKMTAAEANEAIARMVKARKNDDRILPVRGGDQEPAAGDEVERPAALDRPIPLPGALEGEPETGTAVVVEDEPRPRIPDDAPSLLLDPTPPRAGRRVARETTSEPAAEPPARVAMAERNEEASQPVPSAVPDEELVRSAQLPPPPPIRPIPGAGTGEPEKPAAPSVPLDAPKEEPTRPAEPTPKPADEPVKPDATPTAPAPETAPKPAEEPVKPAEPAPTPEPAPQAAEAPVKPVVSTSAAAAESTPAPATPQVKVQPRGLAPITPALAVEDATAVSGPVAPALVVPVAQAPVAQAPAYVPTATVAAAAPVPAKAHRWSFWNWKGSKGGSTYASPQSMPAQLPPATFPASYGSYWAQPLTPCPPSARFPLASSQAPAHSHECEETAAAAKAPCWLVERFKGRVQQFKAWKEEHICRHLKDFKAALKGDRCQACQACRTHVSPTPQAAPAPSPQASPQDLPVIGGSRFGLY